MQYIGQIIDHIGIDSPEAKEKIRRTAEIIYENAMRHLSDLHVGRTGELRRSLHWRIFNAAGNNEVLINFYVQNVASFVELATRRGAHATQIAPVAGLRYDSVPRKDDAGRPMHRRAKPFLANEIRLHLRILHDILMKDYAYLGNALMVYGLTPKNPAYMSRDAKQRVFGARWEIDEARAFGYTLTGSSEDNK